MKHIAIEDTVDAFPMLTPFERHLLFLETRAGKVSQSRYFELLKSHFPKKDLPKIKKEHKKNTLIHFIIFACKEKINILRNQNKK